MIDLIEQHKNEIIALCKEYGVSRLEVFGSAVTGEFDPDRSDVDFLVEYAEDHDWTSHFERRERLMESLSDLLGRKVDLVVLKNVVNPYVVHSIEKSRTLLYAA